MQFNFGYCWNKFIAGLTAIPAKKDSEPTVEPALLVKCQILCFLTAESYLNTY